MERAPGSLLDYCFEHSVDVAFTRSRIIEAATPTHVVRTRKPDKPSERVPRCSKCDRISVWNVCRRCATPEDAKRQGMPELAA